MTDLMMEGSSPLPVADDAMMEDSYDATATTHDIDMAEAGEDDTFDMGDEQMETAEEDPVGGGTDWDAAAAEDMPMEDDTIDLASGFRSPPLVQTWDDGREVQAIGHTESAATDFPAPANEETLASMPMSSQPEPTAGEDVHSNHQPDPSPSTSRDPATAAHPSPSRTESRHQEATSGDALLTQDQDREEDGQSQSQAMKPGEHGAEVESTQHQDGTGEGAGDEQHAHVEVQQRKHRSRSNSLEVHVDQDNEADPTGDHRELKQVNEVHVTTCDHDAEVDRPKLDLDPLAEVVLPDVVGDQDQMDFSTTSKQPITLVFRDELYSLFRRYPDDAYEHNGDLDAVQWSQRERTVLWPDEDEAEVYYAPLSRLFAKLHEQFPIIDDDQQALLLKLPVLSLTLNEDSIYAREVSLYDLDRLYLGSILPGSLHIVLEEEVRFASRFNTLSAHVAVCNETRGRSDEHVGVEDAHHDEQDEHEVDYDDDATVTALENDAEEAQDIGDETYTTADVDEAVEGDESVADGVDETAGQGADVAHDDGATTEGAAAKRDENDETATAPTTDDHATSNGIAGHTGSTDHVDVDVGADEPPDEEVVQENEVKGDLNGHAENDTETLIHISGRVAHNGIKRTASDAAAATKAVKSISPKRSRDDVAEADDVEEQHTKRTRSS